MKAEPNAKALLPIVVFVVLYLGLGIILEYGLKINMGFYQIPVVGVFLVGLLVACLQNKKLPFNDKMNVMAKNIGDPNIFTMILIFLFAGAFVGIVGRTGAESVAYCFLSIFPAEWSVVVMFLVAAFVSLAMGTSVGTITLITPISIVVAEATGFSPALCVGVVVGGAMFGDNLSFISDTTIAACQGQGVPLKDKFRENLWIALPAAIVATIIIAIMSVGSYSGGAVTEAYNLLLIVPYLIVFILAVIGINVFVVLCTGIVSGALVMFFGGYSDGIAIMSGIGGGISGMFETAMVAILVAAICGLVIEFGGFEFVLKWIKSRFHGKRGGMAGVALLTVAMDVSTANNTVAIVMANPLAKEISQNYGFSARRTASILDTFSCIAQGIIPYGAQMLVALSVVSSFGLTMSAFDIMAYLIYPYVLLVFCLIFIFFIYGRVKFFDRNEPKDDEQASEA